MKIVSLILLIIQTKAKSYFYKCSSYDWLEEIIKDQDEEITTCTIANARLFTPCSVLVAQLAEVKFDRERMYSEEWYRMMTQHGRDQINYFAEAKLTMLARSISAMKCTSIAHQILQYYPHYALMSGINLNGKMAHSDILHFTHIGLQTQVTEEENMTKTEQRKAGLKFQWPGSFGAGGTTKLWAQIKDEKSHFLEFNRKRRDTDDAEADRTLISLNALSNLEDTLRSLNDELSRTRQDFNDMAEKDELKLNVLEADLTTNIGGRIDSGFRKQDAKNDARLARFKPANSSALITIVILQAIIIMGLLMAVVKKINTANAAEC